MKKSLLLVGICCWIFFNYASQPLEKLAVSLNVLNRALKEEQVADLYSKINALKKRVQERPASYWGTQSVVNVLEAVEKDVPKIGGSFSQVAENFEKVVREGLKLWKKSLEIVGDANLSNKIEGIRSFVLSGISNPTDVFSYSFVNELLEKIDKQEEAVFKEFEKGEKKKGTVEQQLKDTGAIKLFSLAKKANVDAELEIAKAFGKEEEALKNDARDIAHITNVTAIMQPEVAQQIREIVTNLGKKNIADQAKKIAMDSLNGLLEGINKLKEMASNREAELKEALNKLKEEKKKLEGEGLKKEKERLEKELKEIEEEKKKFMGDEPEKKTKELDKALEELKQQENKLWGTELANEKNKLLKESEELLEKIEEKGEELKGKALEKTKKEKLEKELKELLGKKTELDQQYDKLSGDALEKRRDELVEEIGKLLEEKNQFSSFWVEKKKQEFEEKKEKLERAKKKLEGDGPEKEKERLEKELKEIEEEKEEIKSLLANTLIKQKDFKQQVKEIEDAFNELDSNKNTFKQELLKLIKKYNIQFIALVDFVSEISGGKILIKKRDEIKLKAPDLESALQAFEAKKSKEALKEGFKDFSEWLKNSTSQPKLYENVYRFLLGDLFGDEQNKIPAEYAMLNNSTISGLVIRNIILNFNA